MGLCAAHSNNTPLRVVQDAPTVASAFGGRGGVENTLGGELSLSEATEYRVSVSSGQSHSKSRTGKLRTEFSVSVGQSLGKP